MGRGGYKSILAIDTSYLWVSAATYKNGKVVSSLYLSGFKHLEKLNVIVEKVANIPVEYPQVLLINTGPGFFTSLRVSASFAKAFYLYRRVPIFGFNTLQSMLVGFPDGKYIALLDARKEEFYAQSFNVKGGIPEEDNGLPLGIYRMEVLRKFEGYKTVSTFIRAGSLITLFLKGFGKPLDENFSPLYIRPPDAMVNLAAPRAPSKL